MRKLNPTSLFIYYQTPTLCNLGIGVKIRPGGWEGRGGQAHLCFRVQQEFQARNSPTRPSRESDLAIARYTKFEALLAHLFNMKGWLVQKPSLEMNGLERTSSCLNKKKKNLQAGFFKKKKIFNVFVYKARSIRAETTRQAETFCSVSGNFYYLNTDNVHRCMRQGIAFDDGWR